MSVGNAFVPFFPELLDEPSVELESRDFEPPQSFSNTRRRPNESRSASDSRNYVDSRIRPESRYFSVQDVSAALSNFCVGGPRALLWRGGRYMRAFDGASIVAVSDEHRVQLTTDLNNQTLFRISCYKVQLDFLATFWATIELNGKFLSIAPSGMPTLQDYAPYFFQLVVFTTRSQNLYSLKHHLGKFISAKPKFDFF